MDWRKIERHQLSADYGDISGDDWDEFLADFKDGGNIGRKIVLFEDKVLDGWQLLRAHRECNVKPEFRELPKRWHSRPDLYVKRVNDNRRHEDRSARDERRKRIAGRREAGESIRKIAKAEGVSTRTVVRDLATVSPDTVPEKVTGLDGVERPSSSTILCDRCKRCDRVGQKRPKRCPECADLRRTGPKKKQNSGEQNGEEEKPVDAFGRELPARCRSAYKDHWIQETYDLLTTVNSQILKARLPEGMNKRKKHYPFFVVQDFNDAVGFVVDYLGQLIEHMKDNRPAGVCPSCEGKGCGTCKMSGMVPRKLYEELKKK